MSEFNITDASANDSEVFVQEVLTTSEQVQHAFANSVSQIYIFLEPQEGHILRNSPKALKAEVDYKVGSNAPLKLRFSRTGKLIVETSDIKCAQAVADIKSLLHVPIKTYIQQETITSYFVLHNIDKSINLEELKQEIQEKNPIKIKELCCFTKKSKLCCSSN